MSLPQLLKQLWKEDGAEEVAENNLKMYILVRDSIPVGHAINSVAHAAIIAHETFKEDPIYQEWLTGSFRKVTCKVTDLEFERAKKLDNEWIICKESKLDAEEICLVFKPVENPSAFFKYLRLYRS